ncbi:hypothetical protein CANINC_005023 [Pichia inconspicua]|uniref:Retrotransposon gag domain-containing protein n=1 Tax=Pichia inconspicua TaxID=52247 RepID=A0A4T0WV04_9ASCO|nr:hypothetical protein CANINC_005023 [[Candida] inconspicua]
MIASTPLSVPSVEDTSLVSTVNLTDSASERLQEAKNSGSSTRFKVDLLEEYYDVDEELSRGESYTALKLYQGQLSVDEYAQKFRELATRWFPEETEKTRFMRFVLGLKPELAAEVRKMDSTKLSKAIARAKTVESTLKETSYSYQNRGCISFDFQ